MKRKPNKKTPASAERTAAAAKPGGRARTVALQDVPSVSAPEPPEPQSSSAAVPIWLIFAFGVLVYWSLVYLDEHGGGMNAAVYEPYVSSNQVASLNPTDPKQLMMQLGASTYSAACSLCHQPNGAGTPQFPPLAGSDWVLAEDPSRLIRIPIHGLQGPIEVNGVTWTAAMPAVGGALSDEEIAALLTFVRNSWGNEAPMVTPEQVAEVRQATANRTQPWTSAELLQIPLQ